MDRTGANFFNVEKQVAERLKANPVTTSNSNWCRRKL